MKTVGFFGLALALVNAVMILVGVTSGKVPARWPFPHLDRSASPMGFWAVIIVYAVGAALGGLAATTYIP